MFQSAISCKDYNHFVQVCKESEEKAMNLMIKYTNTTQGLLQETIDAIWHGGKLPDTSFSDSECALQEKIARGEYAKIFKDSQT